MKDSPEFGTTESSFESFKVFLKLVDLLEEIYEADKGVSEFGKGTVYPLMFGVLNSCQSVALLAPQGKVRDIFMISRAIFETSLNIAFVLASSDSVADELRDHADQKSFRDFHRELEYNKRKLSIGISGGPQVPSAQTKDLLDRFTTQRGREVRSWTGTSVIDRLKFVDSYFGEKVGFSFAIGLMAVYRHSSEIIHGSLHGALFSVGLTRGYGREMAREDLVSFHLSNLQMLLHVLTTILSALVVSIGVKLEDRELQGKAEALRNELGKLS